MKRKQTYPSEPDPASGVLTSFDLLWGEKKRGGRGPKPELSLDAMVSAAIDVADTEGLAALTMGRVAEQLGVTTMALYRYVPGKSELIDLITDKALGPPPNLIGREWRIGVSVWAKAAFTVLRKRPWLIETATARASAGPNWVAWVESALRALSGLGLSAREMTATVLAIDGHVRSAAQVAVSVTGSGEWAANFGRVLERVKDDQRYETLNAVVAMGGFKGGKAGGNRAFEFGLERLLDGIEALSESRRGRARARTHRSVVS